MTYSLVIPTESDTMTPNEKAIVNAPVVTWFKREAPDNLSFYKTAYLQAKENGNEALIVHYAKMIAEEVTK